MLYVVEVEQLHIGLLFTVGLLQILLSDTCNDRREDIQIKWATVCRMEVIKGTFTSTGHTNEVLESSIFTSKRLEKQQLA